MITVRAKVQAHSQARHSGQGEAATRESMNTDFLWMAQRFAHTDGSPGTWIPAPRQDGRQRLPGLLPNDLAMIPPKEIRLRNQLAILEGEPSGLGVEIPGLPHRSYGVVVRQAKLAHHTRSSYAVASVGCCVDTMASSAFSASAAASASAWATLAARRRLIS